MQGNNIKSLSKLFVHKNNKKMKKEIELEVFFFFFEVQMKQFLSMNYKLNRYIATVTE